jgi:hypothetical protein
LYAQIPESEFAEVKELIQSLISASSRSGQPAIYGIVAAAEVERLKPLSASFSNGNAQQVRLSLLDFCTDQPFIAWAGVAGMDLVLLQCCAPLYGGLACA